MRLFSILLVIFFLFTGNSHAQQSGSIATVQLYPKGNEIGLPIILLNSQTPLVLEFDVFGDDAPYYTYKIEHYSANWQKSNINSVQFIKGFSTGNINDYEYSFESNINYTHYDFEFPNANTKFKISGNYKISVYEEGVKEPVLTERFMVTEQTVAIRGEVENAASLGKLKSHHQIDFAVNYEGFVLNNPRQELQANIMQNRDPNTMLTDVKAQRELGNELQFTNPFGQIFPAGNEFRWFNIKSTRYKAESIAEHIIGNNGEINTYLIPDTSRKHKDYRPINDLNGGFIIAHQEGIRPDVDSDYVNVHFTLQENEELKDKDIYVYGAFTNWKIDKKYKLEYNPKHDLLEAIVLLKQGNYDYSYAVVDKDGTIHTELTEGNYYRTRNKYTIFVYYKPFGARYDRLIGVQRLESQFN